ncbi:MAG: DUF4837 family protein [Gemmatimonadetes bacterium]|nr:DUF4837 family protein [Gemmatimonadota bacterium]
MRRRTVLAAFAAALVILGSGCEGKQVPAVGPAYEIVVLAPTGKKILGEEVAKILSGDIITVRPEKRFDITQDKLDRFRYYTTRKILFAVSNPDDPDYAKLSKRATGIRTRTDYPGLEIEVDPFAAGQVMFRLVGDPQEIVHTLRDRGNDLIDVVEDTTVTLILTNIYRAGEKEKARPAMLARWGFGVRIPVEWVVEDRSSETTNFVRIWHDAPVEQMFVSWEDGRVERTPEEWIQRRHELGWVHYDRDQVVWDMTGAVLGRAPFGPEGTVIKGVWKNDKYVIGGPFESYAFYCPDDDRTYLVDLSVYAPDRDKGPLMRVLRAVSRTFQCGCVPPPTPGAAS